MKQKSKIIFQAGIFLLSACSSLKDSSIDEKMRFQGSFSCKAISEEKPGLKETLAEADVSRIRCAKDEWEIHGDKITFTRTLYQSKLCDQALGRIQFSSAYDLQSSELKVLKPHCKLLRLTPGWLGEESGKCLIKDLSLNQAYDLNSVYHCHNYVPEFCSESSGLSLGSVLLNKNGDHNPYAEIWVHEKNDSAVRSCKRYAAE